MLKDFDSLKTQLKDLAEVVNKFQSEAVQLRVVELVFGLEGADEAASEEQVHAAPKRKSKKRTKSKKATKNSTAKKPGKRASGQGAVATLSNLVDDDFFSKPKTISDIVAHCEENMARKFKANEFSGKLGRLVREKTLKRTKNSDNQYEYQNS